MTETNGHAKPRDLKIIIATPCGTEEVKRGYAYSLARAMMHFAQIPYGGEKWVDIEMVWSSNLPENRHILVSRAFQRGATHLLFWDSDIRAPKDCIARLANHNAPVVAINYAKKEPEMSPTAYHEGEAYVGPVWTQEQHTGLTEVTSCGFGLMLVDMRVFEAIEPPLFVLQPIAPEFVKTESEDVYFCRKVRAEGIPIVIDHDLSKQCTHIGGWEYSLWQSDIAQAAKQQTYRLMDTKAPDPAA